MTKLAVPIWVHDAEGAMDDCEAAKSAGADLVELRIDSATDDVEGLVGLVEACPLPCLVTCRPVWEGGAYDGDDQERIAVLERLCLASPGPAYVDVELLAYQRSANLRQKVGLVVDHADQSKRGLPGLILSSHDFETRPSDLTRRVAAIAEQERCRVVKVAWSARSVRDNLEALELIRDQHKPTIALCMGEAGLMSRVLAKKAGALLTFARLDDGSGTAPGQPTLAELKGLYRWDKLKATTRVYGVIGWPVGHSKSPQLHNAGFEAVGYDGLYLPMPVAPAYEAFKATAAEFVDTPWLDFRGASVTIPHKENLLRFVAERGGEIEALTQKIGAANTLTVRDDGSLYASNTDYAAALDAVADALSTDRAGLAGLRVLVLGAGGAARAIVAGFADCGCAVTVVNRTAEKAEALAEAFGAQAGAMGEAGGMEADVVINCTPLGMHPEVNACSLPEDASVLLPGVVVFDTIYNPVETVLLRRAKAAGCATVSGVEMFVRQGAAQFEGWTGQSAPLEVLRGAV
ncbi:MAG: shikimate dehydrogenase [Planctomycetota bacterium]